MEDRQRLEGIIELSHLLLSPTEPETALRSILETATRLFEAQGCSIALSDPTSSELAFVAMEGEAKVEHFRMPVDRGIAGAVLRSGEGVVANDVHQDPRFYGTVDRKTGFETHALMCAPIRLREDVVGVIQALNPKATGGFSEGDLSYLTALGRLAGVVIAGSRMLSDLRRTGRITEEFIQSRYRLVVGSSPAMQEVVELARTVAATEATVLLLGESGTGKEVVARAIHQWSRRSSKPFVAVHCAALTPELLASELFGHERGAFTGAVARKMGRFELAQGGTLFLDEIGELPPDIQVKLLRVLQEKEFERVGGVQEIRADVRILAATNRDLRAAMAAGSFRQDLFYRLNVVALTLPPLRDRPEDIPVLAEHFLDRYRREMNRPLLQLSPEAAADLKKYPWPGNVRELQNTIERAVVLAGGEAIRPEDLPLDVRGGAPPLERIPPSAGTSSPEETILREGVERYKRRRILEALEAVGGSQVQAAKRLGLAPSNLSRMMRSLGLRGTRGS